MKHSDPPYKPDTPYPGFDEWLHFGITQGWCGPAICETHDGTPLTASEETEMFEEGFDPCIHILRLYEDIEMKEMIEENHSPSVWRYTNRFGDE